MPAEENAAIPASRELTASDRARRRKLANVLGSPRLTLVIFVVLVLAEIWVNQDRERATSILALPLGLLSINLIAALLMQPVFREKLPLTMFHIALLAVVVLATLGRLTYLKGGSEVSTGADFDGSFSAEHGVGARHREKLTAYASAQRLALMRTIKQAIEPGGLMNPGKIL